jgi:hypothetical protein
LVNGFEKSKAKFVVNVKKRAKNSVSRFPLKQFHVVPSRKIRVNPWRL